MENLQVTVLPTEVNELANKVYNICKVKDYNHFTTQIGFVINSLTTNGNIVFDNGNIKSNAS